MTARDLTLDDVERLDAAVGECAVPFHMDEEAFRAFYDRTARMVWAYLSRTAGDAQVADDLLQEAYFRFLRCGVVFDSESHRRNYLFRIATNLVHDLRRRQRTRETLWNDHDEDFDVPADGNPAEGAERRADLRRSFGRLSRRDRELLWLAYAEGSSHREIAEVLGLGTASIKQLLFRARRRLAALMSGCGDRGRRSHRAQR